jgi:hypothetical protein
VLHRRLQHLQPHRWRRCDRRRCRWGWLGRWERGRWERGRWKRSRWLGRRLCCGWLGRWLHGRWLGRWFSDGGRRGGWRQCADGRRELVLRRHAHRVRERVRRPLLEPRALRAMWCGLRAGRGLQSRHVSGVAARLHVGPRLWPRVLLRPHQSTVHDRVPPHRRLSHRRDVHGRLVSVPHGPTRVRSAVCLRHGRHLVRKRVQHLPSARELDGDLRHASVWFHLRDGLRAERLDVRRRERVPHQQRRL